MVPRDILNAARLELDNLIDTSFDIIEVKKPSSVEYARVLPLIISKISPLVGNLIEVATVDILNKNCNKKVGSWIRQDPGFPDALFKSAQVIPNPGIEIKAWYPLSTEITARFKESAANFATNHVDVALIAWLPEHILWGKPKIIDILIISALDVANSRDSHYHNPPYYLIKEPNDTKSRTSNLQQTNTEGFVLQRERVDSDGVEKEAKRWDGIKYCSDKNFQKKILRVFDKFLYRQDTNYAKIDRIENEEIANFKRNVMGKIIMGKTVNEWAKIFSSKKANDDELKEVLSSFVK